jgi:hypothetical protein
MSDFFGMVHLGMRLGGSSVALAEFDPVDKSAIPQRFD